MNENGAGENIAALGRAAGLALVEGDGAPIVKVEKDLNKVAQMLGQIVSRLDLFEMNGELVFFDHRGDRQLMTARKFCTWINDHVLVVEKFDRETGNGVPTMLGIEASAVVLESENFRRGVRVLKAVNQVRLPVVRLRDGEEVLEKLPWGYDEHHQVFTVRTGGIDYETEMDLAVAKGTLERIFGTFPFSDDRSKAVQVAAMLALFVKHLPGGTGLRPGFLWLANKPGSGKSVLAKACLFPVLGRAAAAKMKKNEELDKELEAFSRARVPYIFLDNVYGGIQSASLDGLLTSEESTGRAMGGHGVFVAENAALLLVTGNRLELNEDAARRFLVVDLFEKGEPGDRPFDEGWLLNDAAMKSVEWRSKVLSALWALVENWVAQGQKRGGVVLASFEDYSRLLGGIVESAGYGAPFAAAVIPDAINPEKQEFVELLEAVVEEMAEDSTRDFSVQDLAMFARAKHLFLREVGTQQEGVALRIKQDGIAKEDRGAVVDNGTLDPKMKSAWGKLLVKRTGNDFALADGRKVEFGKRDQARKPFYTVTILAKGRA